MKNIKSFGFLLLMLTGVNICGWSLTEIRVDVTPYQNSAVENHDRDGGIQGSFVNLIDKDIQSYTRINSLHPHLHVPLYFESVQVFDSIAFRYYALEDGLPRCMISRVRVTVLLKNEKVLEQEYSSDAETGRVILPLSYSVKGDTVVMKILETSGEQGRQFIYLSEMDVLKRGQSILSYDRAQIEEKYYTSYREYRLQSSLFALFSGVKKVVFAGLDQTLNIWKGLGIPIHRVWVDHDHDMAGLYIELDQFQSDQFRGYVYVGVDGGKIFSPDPLHYSYRLIDKMAIGEWYIDGRGTLWVRIGTGPWKKSRKKLFSGTDLGDYVSVGMPYVDY